MSINKFEGQATILVVTHNGTFHADEVLGVAVCKWVFAASDNIVRWARTRDPERLKGADIVLDVGGEFDPSRYRFDHHQVGGAGSREVNGVSIPYSSAGLAWHYLGKEYLRMAAPFYDLTPEQAEEVADVVDEQLFAGVDAIDNGKTLYTGEIPLCTFSSLISRFNTPDDPDIQEWAFGDALDLAYRTLELTFRAARAEVRARTQVRDLIRRRQIQPVLELPKGMPWQRVVCREAPDVLFVVFPAKDNWRAQAVPVKAGSFEIRQRFPESWGGLSTEALVEATGVQDAIFCHRAGFIAGAKTREGIYKMLQLLKIGSL